LCTCAWYDLVPVEAKRKVYGALVGAGGKVEVVPDLCGLAAKGDPRLAEWAKAESLKIVACYPRAIEWLFHAAGAPLGETQVEVFNLRTQDPDEVVRALIGKEPSGDAVEVTLPEKSGEWTPWFPVIDYSRCKSCKQCFDFCLFGTFTVSENGRVDVSSPASCKTNCPACARVCPHKAIIFPKYADSPINGDEVLEESTDETGADGKLSGMLQGNIRDVIRSRTEKTKRFSTNPEDRRNSGPKPSMEKLRRDLDIPLDVLRALTPEEMQRVRAKSKATADEKPGKDDDNGREGKTSE